MRSVSLFAALALAPALAATTALAAVNESPAAPMAPVPKGIYSTDKAHTSLLFRVSHIGFSHWTGRFSQVDTRLQFDPDNLAASSVEVNIDPRSIQADNTPDGFLASLAGKDWLDADHFPRMTFKSKSVEVTGKNGFVIHGELSLHGVTRPMNLEAHYNGGYAGHPLDPHARAGFSAHGSFKRSDFGVSYGIPAPGTTMGVGDEVEVIVETELSGPALHPAKG